MADQCKFLRVRSVPASGIDQVSSNDWLGEIFGLNNPSNAILITHFRYFNLTFGLIAWDADGLFIEDGESHRWPNTHGPVHIDTDLFGRVIDKRDGSVFDIKNIFFTLDLFTKAGQLAPKIRLFSGVLASFFSQSALHGCKFSLFLIGFTT